MQHSICAAHSQRDGLSFAGSPASSSCLHNGLFVASRSLAFSRRTEFSTPFVLAALLLASHSALAQETPPAPSTKESTTSTEILTTETPTSVSSGETTESANADVSTQQNQADAGGEASQAFVIEQEPVTEETPPEPPPIAPLPQPNASAAQLFADSVRVENGVVIAESQNGKGVRLESSTIKVFADRVTFDTKKRILNATGKVRVERPRAVERIDVGTGPKQRKQIETITETLRGENFEYNFESQQGRLDKVQVQLADFSVKAESLVINGRLFTATNVILRPGGLTPEEEKIYGTPPFNVRARIATYDASGPRATTAISRGTSGAGGAGGTNETGQLNTSTPEEPRVVVKNASLYYKNTRLFPIPGFVFRRLGNTSREPEAFTLTPRISLNSTDGVLLTTQLRYPFSLKPDSAVLNADLGLSTKIGFRGGLELEKPTDFGNFSIGVRENDIVTAQLTSRIVLDRRPQLTYTSPMLPLFELPGGRLAGARLVLDYGRFNERTIGSDKSDVDASRSQAVLRITTRARDVDGLYGEIIGRWANYSILDEPFKNLTFEVGYQGQLLPRVRGIFSYRHTNTQGRTPFRFDKVSIKRELRSTFDFELTKKYLIPIDLRYDVTRGDLRDTSFGLLRNYKTFAYGFVYSTAREELRFELRQGF